MIEVEEDNIVPVNFERKPEPKTVKRNELIDDFIRNFFIKNNLVKSLEAFQVSRHHSMAIYPKLLFLARVVRGRPEGENQP